MTKTLSRDLALLALRLGGLGLAVGHGWGKVAALAAGGGEGFIAGVEALGFPLPALFAWAAALAELVGGLCLALGLGTRIASGFVAFTMFVAAFLRHRFHLHVLVWLGVLDVEAETVERWGSPELAMVYLLGAVALALLGGGRLSVDHLLLGRRRQGA